MVWACEREKEKIKVPGSTFDQWTVWRASITEKVTLEHTRTCIAVKISEATSKEERGKNAAASRHTCNVCSFFFFLVVVFVSLTSFPPVCSYWFEKGLINRFSLLHRQVCKWTSIYFSLLRLSSIKMCRSEIKMNRMYYMHLLTHTTYT